MKNYVSMFLATVALVTFVNSANAQSNINQNVNPAKSATPVQNKPRNIPEPPLIRPATVKITPIISDNTIQDLLVSTMKRDSVYTKTTGIYLKEFNRILTVYKTREDRAKAFAILDKKYPKTSATVRKYFGIINKEINTSKPPVIKDVPVDPKKEYYAVRKEMELFVSDLIRIKTKIEALEKKIDSMRN
jgi:hypothetical protein